MVLPAGLFRGMKIFSVSLKIVDPYLLEGEHLRLLDLKLLLQGCYCLQVPTCNIPFSKVRIYNHIEFRSMTTEAPPDLVLSL